MNTCDGCYYYNPRTAECMREYYPELEEEDRRRRQDDRERRKEAMRRFMSRLLPWNWFNKEKQP